MKEAKKTKCYKRLIYKQFFQVSGPCCPQFLSQSYLRNVSGTFVELILRFHCHGINTAEKNKLETVQCKKPRLKLKFYKRLIYKQFVQISGLCGPQFLSYLSNHFTHFYRALYGDALLLRRNAK